MPGEQFDGDDIRKFIPKDSEAFCDGMTHRQGGTLIGRPITDNPFDNEGNAREAAWDAGWTVSDDAAGGTIGATDAACCPLIGAAVSA